jgi:predicted RNase H-like HicB family nuclease
MDPVIEARADRAAGFYAIDTTFDDEFDCFVGRVREMPHVMGDGETPEACEAMTREALAAVLAYMLEEGDVPTPPDSLGPTTCVNVELPMDRFDALSIMAKAQRFENVEQMLAAAAALLLTAKHESADR